jgi:hypothetical protein
LPPIGCKFDNSLFHSPDPESNRIYSLSGAVYQMGQGFSG